MEFLSVPVPGLCSVYYLFSSRPKTQFAEGFVQMSILDMNLDNTAYGNAPPGSCNSRKGRLLELSEEVWNLYPQLDVWGGLGYLWENTDVPVLFQVPTSLYVSRLSDDENGKSQSPILRVVQGQAPGDPTLLFAIMTTQVYVYSITSQGIQRVNTVAAGTLESYALGQLPLWFPYDADWTDKQYKYDADARRLSDGSIRLAITANYGMYALPALDETYNLLTMRFNASNGTWIPGSTEGYRIYTPPNGCNSLPPGISQAGLVGCAISAVGNEILVSGERTPDCSAWYPYVAKQQLGGGALTDITASVPNAQAYVRSRFYRNRIPGSAQEGIYIPHATGVALVQNWEGAGTALVQTTPITGAAPPVFSGVTSSYYMPRFLNTAVQGDTHLSAGNLATCCSYFQTVPGAVAGGFTRTAGQSNWNGASNEAQPGSSTVVFNCDVVVEPGGRLFASNMTWRFTNNAKVVVKPGGYLDLNNCTLTGTACYQARWPGMEVWGNAFYTQISTGTYQIPTYQGKLNAVNTTIENAEIGVLVSRRAAQTGLLASPYEGGGVVIMNGGTVRNCERGVDFRQYPWSWGTSGPLPQPNQSRFTRTNFHLSQPQGGIFTFTAHARLDRVNGIQFKQCTFKNTVADAWYASGTNPLGSLRLGYGIESYQSEFKVWPGCNTIIGVGQDCPAANVLPTVFEGLDHGIHALGGPNALRNFTVDRATFNKNICGVYSSGVIGFVAKRSSFSFGNRNVPLTNPFENPQTWQGYHRGLYSYNGYGFTVDDNSFAKATGSPNDRKTEGVVIGYSKDHNDYIFRNTGSNLMEGFVGEGVCASLTAGYTPVIGLQFKCNTNQNNDRNLVSRKANDVTGQAQDQHTIRTNQGEATVPMDNLFDGWDGTGDKWDFRVKTTYSPITYWHRNSGVDPYVPQVSNNPQIAALNYLMNPQQVTSIPNNNCTFKVPRLSPLLPDGMLITTVKHFVQAEKLAYGTTRYLYEQLLDGGSTDEVVQEITSAWPQDAWDLRAYLLSKSPYLTTGVLKDMNAQNKLPQAMFVEVCIANPDATKAEGFTKWLEFEAPHPLPEYLIANIEASWNQRTYRTNLELTMADRHAAMSQASNMLIEEYSRDTITDPLDSLRLVWQEVRTPGARYAEALALMQRGEYQAAYTIVEAIPQEHTKLKERELSERDRMLSLITFIQGLAASNRGEEELTAAEQAELQTLSDANDRPAVLAQNLLCFHYGICTAPYTGDPDGEGPKARRPLAGYAGATPIVMAVNPNPTSNWAAVNIRLPNAPQGATLRVLDLTGKEAQRHTVNGQLQQVVLDTRGLAPGAYLVVLHDAGKPVAQEKLIVQP